MNTRGYGSSGKEPTAVAETVGGNATEGSIIKEGRSEDSRGVSDGANRGQETRNGHKKQQAEEGLQPETEPDARSQTEDQRYQGKRLPASQQGRTEDQGPKTT